MTLTFPLTTSLSELHRCGFHADALDRAAIAQGLTSLDCPETNDQTFPLANLIDAMGVEAALCVIEHKDRAALHELVYADFPDPNYIPHAEAADDVRNMIEARVRSYLTYGPMLTGSARSDPNDRHGTPDDKSPHTLEGEVNAIIDAAGHSAMVYIGVFAFLFILMAVAVIGHDVLTR